MYHLTLIIPDEQFSILVHEILLDQFPLCKKSVNLANLCNFLLCEYFRRHLLHEMGLILHLFSAREREKKTLTLK